MPHATRGQIGATAVRQGGLGAGVLLGVVVFPFNADRAVEADAVELDENFLAAIGVAGGSRGDEVPAVGGMAHRAMAAEQAGAGVLADDLHALDVGAVDIFAEL